MRFRLIAALLAMAFVFPVIASAHGASSSEDAALARIEADENDGLLTSERALELRLERIFEPESLPEPYRSNATGFVRCATPILLEARRRAPDLSSALRARIEEWTAPTDRFQKAAGYTSPSGRFLVSYETEGIDAVPLADLSPANGIPDFVERIAEYCDTSYATEFEVLGFTPPDLSSGPYRISFESMGSYGYTVTDGSVAGTNIVLHNTFLGFPDNDDVEGSAIGAAKVSVAHELKHASQFATSGWSETGLWVEVDAVWVEDHVYDSVNDYYNYIATGNSIAAPALSLDFGPTASGSYDDCIWQHWMVRNHGVAVIRDFWTRRSSQPGENVLASYDYALQLRGDSIAEDFVDFAAFNYASGARARYGFGYEEADRYPTAPLESSLDTPTLDTLGQINHLAADLHTVTGFSADPKATAYVRFEDLAPMSPLRIAVLVDLVDGSRRYHVIAPEAGIVTFPLPEAAASIVSLGVVVANGSTTTNAAGYTLQVYEEIAVPQPVAKLGTTLISFPVEAGTQRSRTLAITNIGEAGSQLDFTFLAVEALPPSVVLEKNISGSDVAAFPARYTPDTTADLQFTVSNASPDFEWLAEVDLEFPAGVTVLASSDMLGGTAPLVSDGATGEGVTLRWVDADGTWGNVRGGQTATATVSLAFDRALYGSLPIDFTISGDGYGNAPHSVSGTLLLDGPDSPLLEVLSPRGDDVLLIGSEVEITWAAATTGTVDLEISRNQGLSWSPLASGLQNTGTWTWTVSGPASVDTRIRLSHSDGTMTVVNSGAFTVAKPLPWLDVAPSSGSLQQYQQALVDLHFDATGLGTGAHPANLLVLVDGQPEPILVSVNMTVTDTSEPTTPSRRGSILVDNTPNPFNPSTWIRFRLERATRVRLEILDVRGRRVRSLVEDQLSDGAHAIEWDAIDDDGAAVSSGLYLYVLETVDGETATGKMTLVK